LNKNSSTSSTNQNATAMQQHPKKLPNLKLNEQISHREKRRRARKSKKEHKKAPPMIIEIN
jgi:hypothetical protein